MLSLPTVLLWLAASSPAAEPSLAGGRLRPDLPYAAARSQPVTHEIDFAVTITPPYGCKVLKVWLPLPQSDAAQEIGDFDLTTFPLDVHPQINAEPVYGNRFAYFEFREPKGAQIIRNRFTAKVWQLDWEVDPARVESVADWPAAFAPYRRPQTIERQQEFDQLLTSLVPDRGREGQDVQAIMDWVTANLTYDHAAASLRADANHAFEQRRGHCSDYHGLCATMGRALGYPTRVTYGLSLFPKNSPSHCKLEVFLPAYGWVSYDLSETQKLIGLIESDPSLTPDRRAELTQAARDRLHRGFRENSWLLVTKGTDYDLAPKASQPVRVVRTIHAEADGVPLPDPDPADPTEREFAWMTAHRYRADRPFAEPFKDWRTLEAERE
jgi:transglutaminase-like putative cysteine protease